MAAVVQIAINPKMPRISHPMNCLDHWSSLKSNLEASPAMGLSPQGRWRFPGNHKLRRDPVYGCSYWARSPVGE